MRPGGGLFRRNRGDDDGQQVDDTRTTDGATRTDDVETRR